MSVNEVNKQTGDTSKIAGGTLYADAPIGAILAFGGATAPAGWLLCQGQAVSRTTYAALFAAIGTAFGAGDGSTTFNIPDGREVTLKGAGETGYTVGAHVKTGGLAVGEFLDDRIQSHTHTYKRLTGPGNAIQDGGASFENHDNETTAPTSARTGATTEVKAIGVNYIIKAEQVALPADFATELDKKQNITDNTLQTTSKTVPGAINELNTKVNPTVISVPISGTHGDILPQILTAIDDLTKISKDTVYYVFGICFRFSGNFDGAYCFSGQAVDQNGSMFCITMRGTKTSGKYYQITGSGNAASYADVSSITISPQNAAVFL